MKRVGLGAAIWLVWSVAHAQRSDLPPLSQSAQIPEAGLAFRVMRGADPVGLPQPQVWHYRQSDGSIIERFLPRDLWYPSVWLGQWQDTTGMELIIGQLAPPMPTTFPIPHASHAEYRVAMDAARLTTPASPEALVAWLQQFADATPKTPPRTVSPGPRLAQVLAFDFAGVERARRAYVFRFRPNVNGVDPDQWFVALFLLPPGVDLAAATALDREFVGSLHTVRRPRPTATAARPAPTETPPPASDAYQESVERAINSIRGLPGWWHETTPHYVIVSDLPQGRRSFIERLRSDLETLRAAFATLIPPRGPMTAVSLVRVFAQPESYQAYGGPAHGDTAGVWIPSRRELVVRPPIRGQERDELAELLRIVYHEAFHQYIFYAFDLIPTSPWYNEGHATFFEGAELRGDALRIGERARYAERVTAMARQGPLPLERLLTLDYDTFYELHGGDAAQRNRNYALAWGLIYYLRKGAPIEEDNRYEAILPAYEAALERLRDPQAATTAAFAGVDMAAFSRSFTQFWDSAGRRHRALRHHP